MKARPSAASLASLLSLCAIAYACGEGSSDGAPGRTPAASAADTAAAADPAGLAGAAADRAALRALCDTITNSFRCARAIEDTRLPDTERAARRGDTLLLTLGDGEVLRLEDEGVEHSDVVRWSYQNHWRDPGYFVVHKQYYEGSEHVLIDDGTGSRISLPDRPLLAPDGRVFAVLSLDLVAGYGPNTIQIWRVPADPGGAGPELEYEREPERWGGRDGRWEDAATLRFTQRGYCDALGQAAGERARDMCERPATLTRRAGSWEMESGEEVDGG